MYPGYKPVKILDTFAKIGGQQIYYHAGRYQYSIERDHSYLVALTREESLQLVGMRELEQAFFDAQDRHDDDGKEAGRWQPK